MMRKITQIELLSLSGSFVHTSQMSLIEYSLEFNLIDLIHILSNELGLAHVEENNKKR